MKPLAVRLIALLVLHSLSALSSALMAQPGRHELGIVPFRTERNSDFFHGPLPAKFISGLYYRRALSPRNLGWISQLEYGYNSVQDFCGDYCADAFEGEGRLREAAVLTGLRYTLLEKQQCFARPFVQASLYYAYTHYTGFFQGGIGGGGYQMDRLRLSDGTDMRAGLSLYAFKRFAITAATGFRRGRDLRRNVVWRKTGSFNAFELCIGYRW